MASTTSGAAAPNTNPFSAQTLSQLILQSLPRSNTTATAAQTSGTRLATEAENEASTQRQGGAQLTTSTDAIAIACHAGMLSVDFRLVGLGEEGNVTAIITTTTTTRTASGKVAPQPLPVEWSRQHAFRYRHEQSSMEYLLKISRLGNRTVIYGIGIGDDKTTSFDVLTRDYVSEAALPLALSLPLRSGLPADAAAESGSQMQPQPQSQKEEDQDQDQEEEDKLHAIRNVFISPSRLCDLGSLLKLNIIQKIIPSLQKEGYEDTPTPTTAATTTSPAPQHHRDGQRPEQPPLHDPLRGDPLLPAPARPHPLADPSVAPPQPPRRPIADFPPPDFEDEYELQRPYPRGGGWPGGVAPMGIGERDLYPPGLGPNDPLRVGGIGIGPYAGGGGGGGMHPTFDDPLFGGRRPPGRGSTGRYDPQVPPGARYDDPLGQDGGLRRGRGAGGGAFGGGAAPHNPFGGFGPGDFI